MILFEKDRWVSGWNVIMDGWKDASDEVRKATIKLCLCFTAVVGLLVFGLTSSWRHSAASAPGGVSRDGNGRVVQGWVAFKQEDWARRRWGVALVWGEAWSDWKKGRRTYIGRNGRIQLLKGREADDFTAVVQASGPETMEQLRRLTASDVIRLHVDNTNTVTAVEVIDQGFRVPGLDR